MSYKRSKYFSTTSKRKIRYLFLNKKSQITVVFFHGFMSDMDGKKPNSIQKFCGKKKIGFIKFEYSGHGKSSGKFTDGNISKWTNDAKELINAKTKNKKKLILIGSSMGSWIALNLLKNFHKKIKGFIGIASSPEFTEEIMWKNFSKKIKKIILRNKIYYLDNDYNTPYPITRHLIMSGRKNKIFNKKINVNIPVVLFHGLKDKTVPLKFSKKIFKLFKTQNKKIIRIKDGDHSLSRKKNLKKICFELRKMTKNIT
jgi:alpha-beta hydrolase superfamily lysophospholipase